MSLDGTDEGEWKVEGRRERRKRRWLEDPVPIQKQQEVVNVQENRPAAASREVRREEQQQTTQARTGAERAGGRIAGDKQQQGWGSWAKSILG